MKNRYGNVKRSISTASSYLPPTRENPGANRKISTGAAITPMAVMISRTTPNVPLTPLTRSRTSSWDFVTLYSEITGTKDCEKAPSANRRRRKFGIL